MPFSFLQRGNIADHAKQLSVASYRPQLALENLLTGVDNIRHDVFLSPKFCEAYRTHVSRLIARYGNVEDFLVEDAFSRPPQVVSPPRRLLGPSDSGKSKSEPADFKKLLAELCVVALNQAKATGNPSLDLLARLAILKFQRSEFTTQFNQVLERCRVKLKSFDSARAPSQKAVEMRERFARFQVGKRAVLRRVGQEVFTTWREVEKETLGRMRRSLFGEAEAAAYDLFLNRLLFTEDGRDDYVNAEHYVMLGNYDRDPDRFQTLQEIAVTFLRTLNLGNGNDDEIDAILSAPENSIELVANGTPDESAKGKSQRAILNAWVDALEAENVMEHVIASYEAVPLLGQYSPPINPQQLKNALISRTERKRVETLLEEHGKISPEGMNNAVRKVEGSRGPDRAKIAGRFLGDFIRYHRDLRRMEAVTAGLDSVNVIHNEKLRELSAINNTLYEFLLQEEQKPAEDKVTCHVILKADIRESTMLTRTLFERGLNPASYFSLHFFEPVNKLLPKYGASKVFIEGDAVILALFEREGEPGFGVGRTCVMAKEMIDIVSAYNQQSQKAGLPVLELGLGICYQDSAPMYLMDGNTRIMISKALNESDRLSGCTKGARKYLEGRNTSFHVFSFKTVEDEDTGGNPDEFLLRYNVGGIHMNQAAFRKLQQEIALQMVEVKMPMLWGHETVRLYSGMVPVAQGVFHKIAIREGFIAHIDARDFSFKRWTERRYYEICTSAAIYELVENTSAATAAR